MCVGLELPRYTSLSLVPHCARPLGSGAFFWTNRAEASARFLRQSDGVKRSMSIQDHQLRSILRNTACIACVGMSPNPIRPSHFVGRYLSLKGYRVIPVNPGHAGRALWGEVFYADLADIPQDIPVDMVDIFRRSEHVPPIVDAAIEHLPQLRTVWMQIGVQHEAAAQKAEAHGLTIIQNLCPKMEYQRLFGELAKAGINTRIISSKLPPVG